MLLNLGLGLGLALTGLDWEVTSMDTISVKARKLGARFAYTILTMPCLVIQTDRQTDGKKIQ